MDKFTEVSHKSGLSNIGGSFKGIIFGILLIVGSIYLLWTNEGRAVHVARALEEGSGSVVSVAANKVDPTNEGKLVHVSSLATTKDTVVDEEFDVKVNALKLIRDVEVFQWKEKTSSSTKNNLGGSSDTKTEYTYVKEWGSSPVSSDNFKIKEGHINIVPYAYEDKTKLAAHVSFGAFSLNEDLLGRISTSEKLPVKIIDTTKLKNAMLSAGSIYMGSKNLSNPEVGDVRISYQAVYPKNVSIVAKQIGNTFEEYIASNDETVLLLKEGTSSAENMFKKAIEGNKFKTWLLRWLGFFMMFFGFRGIFKPLIAMGNIIPFVGSMISMGVGIISFALALPISALIIAIAWFTYRPLMSGIIIGSALLIYFYYRSRGKKKAAAAINSGSSPVQTGSSSQPYGSRVGENK
ncbi:MAG: TMEM43 family protein [Bacteroidota bacterium]|nr:TMEM43 family protein [Bacteroidota bacterium]